MEYITKIVKIILLFIYSLFPSSAEVSNIKLQDNFKINIYAEKLNNPRFMALSKEGIPYVALKNSGNIVALPDINNDGKADQIIVKASGLKKPHSLAFYKNWIYIAETNRITRYKYDGYEKLLSNKEVVINNLPTGGHYTRTILFDSYDKMYVSIGSSCNVCTEKDRRRAAIMQYNPDGTGEKVFASGLRNSVGLTINPFTGELWASENGRDWLGDELPHEEINIIKEGMHYGWPYCYDEQIPDPEFGKIEYCRQTEKPVFKMQAHSAPLGLIFYNAMQFPPEYHGDLFVAFHGSWNRSEPTGYKVVKIKMKNNIPVSVDDFASGWLIGNKKSGRPAGLLINNSGELLVSDDYGGKIYRIYYDSQS